MRIKIILLTTLLLAFSLIGFAQSTTPTFTQYAVRVQKTKNVKVNLKSHKDANMFRTNLRNAAKEGVNFAGHYILTTWGCGTNCSQTAIIDARNGKVYFPRELEGAGFGYCELPDATEAIVSRADSRLLILNGFKGGDLSVENAPCGIYYLEWTGTKFRQVKFEEKKRREMSDTFGSKGSEIALISTEPKKTGSALAHARPSSKSETIEQLAKALSEAFTTGALGGLDAERPYLGTVRIIVEHSISGKREMKNFKTFGEAEKWFTSRARDDGPARNSGPLLRCRKGVCTYKQEGMLHNNLYLQKITYGIRKGRPYIKAVYVIDGN